MSLWSQKFPLISKLCDINANRKNVIITYLENSRILYKILQINGANHIVLYPDNLQNGSTLLIAHYDRVETTPGANDNSASVVLLLDHGYKLKNHTHNTAIILTDMEEIGDRSSVKDQGSYGLGLWLRERDINPNIFIFDMCGIGTTLLLGTAGETLLREKYGSSYNTSDIKQKIDSIKERGEDVLLDTNYGEFFYLTPLFSDDLGLILNNYPSILISLLPYREAVEYQKSQEKLPRSWQVNHTPADTIDTLDNRSIDVIVPLLEKLSGVYKRGPFSGGTTGSFKCYKQSILPSIKGRVKPFRSYIIKSRLEISDINSRNTQRLELFRVLTSNTTSDIIDLLSDHFTIEGDISLSIYNNIRSLVEDEFSLLPVAVRNRLLIYTGSSDQETIINKLYANTMKNLKDRGTTPVKPVGIKESVTFDIKTSHMGLTYNLYRNCELFCTLHLQISGKNIDVKGGSFNSDIFLEFDTLNLLKGIRTTLIKWAKLNNNKSLTVDLNPCNWIGGYNLLWLLTMELKGRSNRLWREFNGK